MGKRINIPPSLGGGDFVIRELLAGEFEDALKAQGEAPKGKEFSAIVDTQAHLCLLSLVEWRGKPVPKGGAEGDAFWRGLTAAQRTFLIGIHERMNQVRPEEIDAYFAGGVPVATPTTR
jgi:hypothetical protein